MSDICWAIRALRNGLRVRRAEWRKLGFWLAKKVDEDGGWYVEMKLSPHRDPDFWENIGQDDLFADDWELAP